MDLTWKIIPIISILLIGCYENQLNAQSNDFGVWSSVFIKKKIDEKYSILGEAHIRRKNIDQKRAQERYALSAAYKINALFSTRLGSSLLRTKKYPSNGARLVIGEVNIWEDLLIKKNKNAITYSFRLRLEQRWVQQKMFSPDSDSYVLMGNTYKNRMRNRLAMKFDFGSEKEYFFVLYNELWLNLKKHFLPESFDQNWAGFVFAYKVTDHFIARIGYQHRLTKPAGNRASNHILQPSIVLNF